MKIDLNNKKTVKNIHVYLRAAIQLLFFIFAPSIYTAAFSGVKEIFTGLGAADVLELSSFITVLICMCIYTIIFGRFFCGFACAFGSFGDFIHMLYVKMCRKLKKKPVKADFLDNKVLPYVKYVVLALIVVSCFLGVYSKTSGSSPWEVFSLLMAGNIHLSGYITGIILLILIIVGMALSERFFCRVLCPMGAVFSLLPILPVFSVRRDTDNCLKGCKACSKNCPMNLTLPDKKSDGKGDCIMCQKCVEGCPKSNIKSCHVKTNEVWFTVLRAVLLAVIIIIAS